MYLFPLLVDHGPEVVFVVPDEDGALLLEPLVLLLPTDVVLEGQVLELLLLLLLEQLQLSKLLFAEVVVVVETVVLVVAVNHLRRRRSHHHAVDLEPEQDLKYRIRDYDFKMALKMELNSEVKGSQSTFFGN